MDFFGLFLDYIWIIPDQVRAMLRRPETIPMTISNKE